MINASASTSPTPSLSGVYHPSECLSSMQRSSSGGTSRLTSSSPSSSATSGRDREDDEDDERDANPPSFHIVDALQCSEVIPLGRPRDLPDRDDGWKETYGRWRSTSLASFQIQRFPFDAHKLQVVFQISGPSDQVSSLAAI